MREKIEVCKLLDFRQWTYNEHSGGGKGQKMFPQNNVSSIRRTNLKSNGQDSDKKQT